MPSHEALQRLADLHGVMTRYDDWAGSPTDVPDATVAAVLAHLGVDTSDDDAVGAAIAAAEKRPWREVLAPTVVVTPHRRSTIVRSATSPSVQVHLSDGGRVDVPATVVQPTGETAELDGRHLVAYTLELPDDLPLGYHSLQVDADGARHSAVLVVAPERCPDAAHLGRLWGWMVQLYAVRSQSSWGVGDYADLAELARWTGSVGGDLLLLNPLHAAAPTLPQVDSPYSPSSRRFRHTGALRVTAVPEVARLDASGLQRLDQLAADGPVLSTASLLDRDATARLQREALELVFAVGRAADRDAELTAFRAAGGDALEEFATWCALADQHGSDWTTWPSELRRPGSPGVRAAAAELADAVDFHVWLQWLCDSQLAAAQAAAVGSGQRVGVIHDLAVGVTPTGADAWALQDVLALGVSVGAPPDSFNQRGQDWALPPLHPNRLAETGYAAFRDMIRAVLRHAGGIRLDHAMGLFRLWWIPNGASPADGAYVRYPADDLLAVLSLEAHLAGAIVVAEDLGTVEDGVPEALSAHGLLGSAVLWFERADDGAFTPPDRYRPDTFASVTTHDLPTALGFWTGEATRVRAELDQLGPGRTEADQAADDERERGAVRALLASSGLLGADETPEALAAALQLAVLRSRSRLVGLSLGDATGDVRQPNLPGTTDAYPNWRLPLPVGLDDLADHAGVRRLVELARAERPRGSARGSC